MHDIIYGIGYLSIFAIFFYALHLYMEKDNPTEFEKLRNAYQKLKYPNIEVYGNGKYYIEYEENNKHIYHYYNNSDYTFFLKQYLSSNSTKIISHGIVNKSDWKKW